MTTLQIDTQIQASLDRTRPYLAPLLQRLALTYGLPMGAAVIIAILVKPILASVLPVIPDSTATILVLALNMFVLVRGWGWMETRYGGTKLFVLYNLVSRARRDFKRLSTQPSLDASLVDKGLQQLERSEHNFIEAMQGVVTGESQKSV